MKDEALKLALEALELHGKQYPHMVKGYCLDAITAIEHALAAPVQEPVAWVCYGAPGKRDIDFEEADINGLPIGTLLYTTPPAAPVQEPMHPEIKKMYEDYFDKWFRESSAAVPENFMDALMFDTAVRDVDAMIALARADEREACATECERMMMYPNGRQESAAHQNVWAAAKAIRAKGNT